MEYMQRWTVSIPINGRIPKNIEPIKIDEVLFHMYDNPDSHSGEFFSTIVLEGDRLAAQSKALILIDNALTKFHFIHRLPLSLRRDDVHILEYSQDDNSDIPKIGPKRIRASLTLWYRIGEDDTKNIISKMQSIKSEKKDVLDIALTYYRVAVCSAKPYLS